MREQSSLKERAIRRVHGVQHLSEMQIREAENHRRSLPQLFRGRSGGAALQEGQDVLRLQPLSRLRLRGVGQADPGEVPGLRVELPDREVAEGRTSGAMSERGMQV